MFGKVCFLLCFSVFGQCFLVCDAFLICKSRTDAVDVSKHCLFQDREAVEFSCPLWEQEQSSILVSCSIGPADAVEQPCDRLLLHKRTNIRYMSRCSALNFEL